jgi:serine O-acetyltransferase
LTSLVAVSRRASSVPPAAWQLDAIVSQLREVRNGHNREHTAERGVHELPSPVAIASIVESLRASLFPVHFGLPELTDQSVDYYVGHTLDGALRALAEQIRRCLLLPGGREDGISELDAGEITRQFAAELPVILTLLESDVQAAYDGDPAARSLDEVMLCFPGIAAITYHRIAHTLYRLRVPLLARLISELSHSSTGIDIHPGAKIGKSFFIDHGTGVVIGETSVIGDRVRLYQGVTLGAKSFPVDASGAIIKGADRHPIIEDDVVIYAGATILGRITIGKGSSIGGNVWLTRSIPPKSRIAQAQIRSEVFDAGAGI